MKISEWLKGSITSHEIYDHLVLAKEFKEKTGGTPAWLVHSDAQTRGNIGEFKGTKWLSPETKNADALCYGWEIAESFVRKYVEASKWTYNLFHGRGSRFDATIEDLEKAGY